MRREVEWRAAREGKHAAALMKLEMALEAERRANAELRAAGPPPTAEARPTSDGGRSAEITMLKAELQRATEQLAEQSRRAAAEAARTVGEIEKLGEDVLADDSFLESYREMRKQQIRDKQARSLFGAQNSVKEICKADWVIEINRASEANWVVRRGRVCVCAHSRLKPMIHSANLT